MAYILSPPPSLLSSVAALSLTLLTASILSHSPFYPYPSPQNLRRSLLSETTQNNNQSETLPLSCSSLQPSNGLINYISLHFCLFKERPFLSIPFLSLFILLQFYVLIKTAQSHFSVVTTKLTHHLNLSPSMGGVTLLALGNGAPDVFASLAAVRSGQYRTGFGAILSAGTFVSAFVVGFVAIYAAPFNLDPGSFVRDVGFYLVAALFLFDVYLNGEISFWQAVGFVGFYVFFVGFVFWKDLGIGSGGGRGGDSEERGKDGGDARELDCERDGELVVGNLKRERDNSSCLKRVYGKISQTWELPVLFLLKLTIPQTAPSQWSRFYVSANIALCPLTLLYACNSFIALDHPIVFLLPNVHFPLWLIAFLASSSLAILHYILEREPPETEQILVVIVAFFMSVCWISTVAGELLNCLAALGIVLEVHPSLLGLTVLAWGNSLGDLVADVAVAKASQPAMAAMAMAGCYAGPIFNMLVGLGTDLVMQTADTCPKSPLSY